MVTEDQTEVLTFLGSPAAHDGAPVERIDTHASIVFLAGSRAWKLKRAVRYDYLDFSTAERRRVLCEAEVRLNRRTAPAIYRGVTVVTRQPDGSLTIGGGGAPVDWLVEMARFDQDGLFDRLAARGALNLALMRPLAVAIADLHRGAAVGRDHGGHAGMAWVIDGNAEGFAEIGARLVDPLVANRVTAAARAELARQAERLDARRAAGLVRECHGDLHLRNIVLIEGRPTLFDAIEFNDEIACIDVLVRPRVPADGPLEAASAAPRQRGPERLPRGSRRHDGRRAAAALPLVPRGGARQDDGERRDARAGGGAP